MKRAFKKIRFRQQSLQLIDKCNNIIRDYQNQDLRLSLRQLYYVLVSANVITNEERSYKNLGSLVSRGRLAGLIDWAAIEDRVREPVRQAEWESVGDLVESALYSYRLPRLDGQEVYCELWVEKAALAGVLQPLAEKFHVTLMVNKGYSSQSAMYESAARIRQACGDYGSEEAKVLYLGDLDPSGEDMVRDIQDRLDLFGCDVEVVKMALTAEQVDEYKLPPNPAKLSDTRARKFVAKYGNESWEVDALPPATLQVIIRGWLEEYLDLALMQKIQDQEEEDKRLLRAAVHDLSS